jgi:type II secretory ATPase GspE/PulE/Tfp pilus assembly ATPase PilB-like protein
VNTDSDAYPKLVQAFMQTGEAFPSLLLKDYARILQHIEKLWDSPDVVGYMNSIILEEREGRKGFPFQVLQELAQIRQVHDFLFPALDSNLFDPFNHPHAVAPAKQTKQRRRVPDLIHFESAPHTQTNPLADADLALPVLGTDEHRLIDIAWPEIHSRPEFIRVAEQQRNGTKIYPQQGQMVGEILQHFGLVNADTLRVVGTMQKRAEHTGQSFGEILVNIGIITHEDLVRALCVQTGVMMVDVLSLSIPSEVLKLFPSNHARDKMVVPIGTHQDVLYLATFDPFAFQDHSFFTALTGKRIQLVFAPRHEIINGFNMAGFNRNIRASKEEFHDLAQKARELAPNPPSSLEIHVSPDVSENDSTIITLVNKMILNAVEEGASDIHIERFQDSNETHIRFRRDGHLEHFSDFPSAYHDAVVSRIKIMAELDISERRRPQDGKISFNLPSGGHLDLRVSTIPAVRSVEFVTLRLLASGVPLPLSELGISQRDLTTFRDTFLRPYGLILVCGPTGSGKTTTLHSVLKELNTDERKIWTAEDPVEIVQPHLCQVQVNQKAGTSFASILRSFLRADPDVIMIGEIRDRETAKIALEASMTGHLVLSTLHTNSSCETVARLLDLDIDPYNLSDALLAILSQRLARKLCPLCAKKREASTQELDELASEYHYAAFARQPSLAAREALMTQWRVRFGQNGKLTLAHAQGCKMCHQGYKGRIGLYELLHATPPMRSLIRHQSSAADYLACGVNETMHTLKQDGIEKVLCGITDMKQVHAACV